MMKRMKGVAMPFEASPSSYAAVYEDPRIRMRHQSLMHDFEDLYKETEAQKDKLKMMKKKKMTLLAEVRFLKQRYNYLKQNQSQKKPVSEKKPVQRSKLVNRSRTMRKEKEHSGKNAAAQIDLNKKKKVYSEKESALQMQISNPGTIPDLNQKERVYSGKEAGVRNSTPIFDLNQISMEEEELQANDEGMRIEEGKMISCVMRGGSDEQIHGDMKLSGACRSIGNGSSRAGKRKISWQDQVALRV